MRESPLSVRVRMPLTPRASMWPRPSGSGRSRTGEACSSTETSDSVFASWLAELSKQLGEVQFFSNYRVPEFHEWALAIDGRVIRAYVWLGERFEVTRYVGEPTSVERVLGVGTRNLGEDVDTWGGMRSTRRSRRPRPTRAM